MEVDNSGRTTLNRCCKTFPSNFYHLMKSFNQSIHPLLVYFGPNIIKKRRETENYPITLMFLPTNPNLYPATSSPIPSRRHQLRPQSSNNKPRFQIGATSLSIPGLESITSCNWTIGKFFSSFLFPYFFLGFYCKNYAIGQES